MSSEEGEKRITRGVFIQNTGTGKIRNVTINNVRTIDIDRAVDVEGAVDGLKIDGVEAVRRHSNQSPNDNKGGRKDWHEGAIGKIGIGVAVVALGATIVGSVRYVLGL